MLLEKTFVSSSKHHSGITKICTFGKKKFDDEKIKLLVIGLSVTGTYKNGIYFEVQNCVDEFKKYIKGVKIISKLVINYDAIKNETFNNKILLEIAKNKIIIKRILVVTSIHSGGMEKKFLIPESLFDYILNISINKINPLKQIEFKFKDEGEFFIKRKNRMFEINYDQELGFEFLDKWIIPIFVDWTCYYNYNTFKVNINTTESIEFVGRKIFYNLIGSDKNSFSYIIVILKNVRKYDELQNAIEEIVRRSSYCKKIKSIKFLLPNFIDDLKDSFLLLNENYKDISNVVLSRKMLKFKMK